MQIQPKIAGPCNVSANQTKFPRFLRLPALCFLVLVGCSGPVGEPEPVAAISQAINVCDETVPANRFIDGFPAYAQCESTNSSAIWSNNGIDTALTSQGAGWVRTQRSGGYQCTEWAFRYMHFRWGIDYQNGNAGGWCDGNLPATLTKSTTPVHGDLIVFAPGVCGADSTTGHIAVIDVVNAAAGTVTLVEENSAGRRNQKISCATCFLHAIANDGTASGGAAGASSGGGATHTSTGGASNGGRAASGGDVARGGAGPVSSGGASVSGSGGAPNGGMLATGGSVGSSGAAGGSAGTTGVSSGGTTGGAFVSAVTGGISGSGTAGQSHAGAPVTPSSDPLSEDINSGCGLVRAAPNAGFSGVLGPFALAFVGFTLRRRSARRRPSSHEA